MGQQWRKGHLEHLQIERTGNDFTNFESGRELSVLVARLIAPSPIASPHYLSMSPPENHRPQKRLQ